MEPLSVAYQSLFPRTLHHFPSLLLSTLIATSGLLSSKEDEPKLKLKLRKGFRWAIVWFAAGTIAQGFWWAIVQFVAMGIQGRRDMSTDKEWTKLKNRSTSQYLQGVDKFLEFAFSVAFPNDSIQMERRTIRCPCNNCLNVYFRTRGDFRYDLLKNGILQSYTIWDKRGEHMDNFYANNEAEVNENLDYEDMLDMLQVASVVIGTSLVRNEERNVHDLSETTEEPTTETGQINYFPYI
ncbi:hypothetical protein Cgig2_004249 [Carnegiea gigantea]|uniref:Transposase-associated domain-containing protein n=1 Tax=Carnegiea gigantea TaxID=171969 RepID=A0A9Q1KGF0_9CARY|nr:hypothetical protein Cgig2_004249 [Carnegiea gigantea]